jgi:YaeC family lipoprotein
MTTRRRFIHGALSVGIGCSGAALAVPEPIRIGTVAGPQAVLLEHARALAAARGLALHVDVRSHGAGIDAAVARGELDAAAWQDGVRFADERRGGPADLVVAAAMFTLPMGLYSRRLASPHQLRDGDAVAIPADPHGVARALVLLQNFGLVVLRDGSGLHANVRDIVRNPRALRIVARPAAGLYDALDGVPLVAMDFDDASRAGLQPARDAVGIEDARTPFGGVLCVRGDRVAQPWLARLVGVLHGDEMKRFALETFHDSVRRPW